MKKLTKKRMLYMTRSILFIVAVILAIAVIVEIVKIKKNPVDDATDTSLLIEQGLLDESDIKKPEEKKNILSKIVDTITGSSDSNKSTDKSDSKNKASGTAQGDISNNENSAGTSYSDGDYTIPTTPSASTGGSLSSAQLIENNMIALSKICESHNIDIIAVTNPNSVDFSDQSIAMANGYVTNDQFEKGIPRQIEPSYVEDQEVATVFFDSEGNCYDSEGHLTSAVNHKTVDVVLAVPGGNLTISYNGNGGYELTEPNTDEYRAWSTSDAGAQFLGSL